jgi:hypothetical protein
MSLTEEARAPFSLVDEINQVRHPSPTFMNFRPCIFIYLISTIPGNGSTSRTGGTQLNGQCDLQSRERAIFPDHPQVVA